MIFEDGCTKLNGIVRRQNTNAKKKVLQWIKRLVPHHRLPLNHLNTFRLLHSFLCCHPVGYSDIVVLRHAESLDMGNVMRSED